MSDSATTTVDVNFTLDQAVAFLDPKLSGRKRGRPSNELHLRIQAAKAVVKAHKLAERARKTTERAALKAQKAAEKAKAREAAKAAKEAEKAAAEAAARAQTSGPESTENTEVVSAVIETTEDSEVRSEPAEATN